MLKLDQHHMIQKLAQRFRALGDGNRLRLLIALQAGESNVSALTEKLGLAQASVSKHLAVLRSAGLVRARRAGTQVFYRVADESLFEMCQVACEGVTRSARHELQALGLDRKAAPSGRSGQRRGRSGHSGAGATR